MPTGQDAMVELWALALDRGYIYGEIGTAVDDRFYGDGPIVLFDLASRSIVGFGMTPQQAIAHIQESSEASQGCR